MKKSRILMISLILTGLLICEACKELPVASFKINPDPAEVGQTVYFQNTSKDATAYDWDFGDSSGSTEDSPSHIYSAEGKYTVVLTAINEDGFHEASKSIEITPSYPCWTRLADLQKARRHHVSAAVNDRIYVMGGTVSEVEVYDPSTNTWTKKANIPTRREGLSACVINGKIYTIGGVSGSIEAVTHPTLEVYDPASDTWTEKTSMPTARVNHASVAFDGKIYVIGGHIGWDDAELYTTIEMYDPETDDWTTLNPNGFIPRWGLSASLVDGKIYTIGGSSAISMPLNSLQTVQVYDPVANTWKNKSDMPTARFHASIAFVNERIFMIGGSDEEQELQVVEAYDPLTDTWLTKGSMPVGMARLAASGLDQLIYVAGGMNFSHDNYSYFFVYDPACDTNSK